MAKDEEPEVIKPNPADLDSLHALPLAGLPMQTPALVRARMIKNSRLESMVEMFRDRSAGSGQVRVSDLPNLLPGDGGEGFRADMRKLEQLSRIPSFDVYSIRIALRDLEFDVEDEEYLKLSEEKRAELSDRMATFTRPLVRHVFGTDDAPVEDAADLTKILRNPDKEETMRRLTTMAETLNVQIHEIPKFLENYGDIFLSLAYFQNILDGLNPKLDQFLYWLGDLRSTWIVKNDRAQDRIMDRVGKDLQAITASVKARFDAFDKKTQDFWEDINEARFREVRRLIISHHRAVGGMLCGLTLKLDAWKEKFPDAQSGGPQSRVEFIHGEVLPGMEYIKALARERARMP